MFKYLSHQFSNTVALLAAARQRAGASSSSASTRPHVRRVQTVAGMENIDTGCDLSRES